MTTAMILAMAAPATEGGQQGGGSPLYMFGMMGVIFAIMYFMIIRPQQKQQRQRREMIEALKGGDRIVTNGGLFATVKDVHEDRIVAVIAEGVKVEIAKNAVGGVVKKKD
ncbi:MAG: preprotein translocase subunit YajC [Candidatus Krumholzibacteriia bacterium]